MFIYRLLIVVFSPLLAAYILWQSASKKSPRYFWQRLGFGYARLPENSLWFHCASVGEVVTLLPVLKNLHKKNPTLKFIISTNTVTGGKIVNQQKLNYLFHSYLPFDWSSAVRRFITTTHPAVLYIMETEIWPNLFFTCHDNGITIHIINARLSSKTSNAKPWIKSLLKTTLKKVDSISARSDQDALAYEQLGANKSIITTVGNMKLASILSAQQTTQENNFSTDRDYVLVASTHDDEEFQIYRQWEKLNRNELLIIAPRHPERAAAIIKKLQCNNISIRSKKEMVKNETEVFLLDTVGELKNYFKNAKFVIMGGSFVPVGGHNILEPAAFNCAIITGPYMDNFKEELALMLDKNAIVQLDSYEQLGDYLTEFLDDKASRSTLKNNTTRLTHNAEDMLKRYTAIIDCQ